MKGPQHAQVGTGSKQAAANQTQSSGEGGPSWSPAGRRCHTRKANSRRAPCSLPTLQRRLDAMRKRDSATAHTAKARGHEAAGIQGRE